MRIVDYLITEKKKYNKRDVSNIVTEASMDFWARVAEMVPEATSGDLQPSDVLQLEKAMAKAVEQWIDYNVPE